jgi:hypothetical protein
MTNYRDMESQSSVGNDVYLLDLLALTIYPETYENNIHTRNVVKMYKRINHFIKHKQVNTFSG